MEEKYEHLCNGRNYSGAEVFDAPVQVSIRVTKPFKTIKEVVHVNVENCRYNTGEYEQRCKAAHPHIDKVEGREVICPYTFDLPHASEYLIEHKQERTLANKLFIGIIASRKESLLTPYKHLFE